MDTALLCTFFMVLITSGVLALTPMEQSMNADIMSDIMDLRRKIMKHQMLLASMRGGNGGNRVLPAMEIALREFFPSGGMTGMLPAQSSTNKGTQTGSVTSGMGPQNKNIANKAPKKSTSIKNVDQSSGTVSSPTKAVIKTMMAASNRQPSMADILKNGPMSMGPSQGINPMAGMDFASMLSQASGLIPNAGSIQGNGKVPKPKGSTKPGASQAASQNVQIGQAGMPFPQQGISALGQFSVVQGDICSETPSKLRSFCKTKKECSHSMICHNYRCCAVSYGHAEILDSMLEQPGIRL